MANPKAPKRRAPRPRRPGDLESHLEEWIETLEELHALTEDEIRDLMRLVANDRDDDEDA